MPFLMLKGRVAELQREISRSGFDNYEGLTTRCDGGREGMPQLSRRLRIELI